MKNQIIKQGDIFSSKKMSEIVSNHSSWMMSVDGSMDCEVSRSQIEAVASMLEFESHINYENAVQFLWEGDDHRVLIYSDDLKGRCEPISEGGVAIWHAIV